MESLNDLEKRLKDWSTENFAPEESTRKRLEALEAERVKALEDEAEKHDTHLKNLQTSVDTLFKKIAENVKAMDDMKWFFNKNSNMFGDGDKLKSQKTTTGVNFEDLESAAAGLGDGPQQ